MTLADKLTDGAGADIWTDAPECAEQVAAVQEAMEEAALKLRRLEQAAHDLLTWNDAETGASADIDWEGLDVRMKNLREALED